MDSFPWLLATVPNDLVSLKGCGTEFESVSMSAAVYAALNWRVVSESRDWTEWSGAGVRTRQCPHSLLMTHTALTIGGVGIHCDRGDLGLWCGQDMI